MYKQILLLLILLMLLLPWFQRKTNLFDVRPLEGDVRLVPDTVLTAAGWFSSAYQDTKDKFLSDNFGFRSFYVRLRNEIYYDLFNKIYAKDVVAGKDGFLYESKYLKTHAGNDFIGEKQTADLFEKIKFVQDTLEKKGIHFAILFAPGKASYYPEHIPSPYDVNTSNTNYNRYCIEAAQKKVNLIDFNKWFLQLKPTTKYPLYPQTGTHWSIYGMHVALDSLVRYIEKHSGKKLPHFDYSRVELSDSLRHPDGDIANGLNLLRELPHFTMAYPEIKWSDTSDAYKPRTTVISDSYWMGIYFTGLPQKLFTEHEFWYYNKQLYHYDAEGKTTNVLDEDLQTKVEKNNILFIMSTEATLRDIGWGIIEDLYNLYHNGPYAYRLAQKVKRRTSEINHIRYALWDDEKWLAQCRKQARELGISVDSSVNMNVLYYYNEVHKNDPPVSAEELREIEILKIKTEMRRSKDWYNHLVKKAADKGISLDSCMTDDAMWLLKENKLKELTEHFKKEIRATRTWLNDVEAKAKKWGISLDSAVAMDAKYMAEQELNKK